MDEQNKDKPTLCFTCACLADCPHCNSTRYKCKYYLPTKGCYDYVAHKIGVSRRSFRRYCNDMPAYIKAKAQLKGIRLFISRRSVNIKVSFFQRKQEIDEQNKE